ncbi:hypothetical protein BH23ACT10_BH23ACT10_40680 [soil metagenome]
MCSVRLARSAPTTSDQTPSCAVPWSATSRCSSTSPWSTCTSPPLPDGPPPATHVELLGCCGRRRPPGRPRRGARRLGGDAQHPRARIRGGGPRTRGCGDPPRPPRLRPIRQDHRRLRAPRRPGDLSGPTRATPGRSPSFVRAPRARPRRCMMNRCGEWVWSLGAAVRRTGPAHATSRRFWSATRKAGAAGLRRARSLRTSPSRSSTATSTGRRSTRGSPLRNAGIPTVDHASFEAWLTRIADHRRWLFAFAEESLWPTNTTDTT